MTIKRKVWRSNGRAISTSTVGVWFSSSRIAGSVGGFRGVEVIGEIPPLALAIAHPT
jgi:hypothetical protein